MGTIRSVTSAEVTANLHQYDRDQRAALQAVREVVVGSLPSGEEVIAWGMPSIRIGGELVLSYAGFKNHNSIFPGLGDPSTGFGSDVEKFRTSKGALQFGKDDTFPPRLMKRIIAQRITEINESFPKKSGVFKEFYKSGQLKAEGTMKNGNMHGKWSWYRADGSRMRSGEFKNGERVGTWVTYTRDSAPHKVTQL